MKVEQIEIALKVTYSAGAYNCRIGDKRASSTMSAKEAATRVAKKVFGEKVAKVEEEPGSHNHLVTWFRITLGEPVAQA